MFFFYKFTENIQFKWNSLKFPLKIKIATHLNFITLLAVKILRTPWLGVLVIAIRSACAIRDHRTRLDVPFWDAFAAIKRLAILAQERVLPVRWTVKVRPAVEVDVLVVAVFLGVTGVRVEIGARVDSLVDAWLAVENLSRPTAERRFASVVAIKVAAARRLQSSILVKPHLKARAIARLRLVTTLNGRRKGAHFLVHVEDLTFAALVKCDGDSTRALDETAAAEPRVDVEAVDLAFAKFIDPRGLWTIVERVGHTILLEWIKDARSWAAMLGSFAVEALHVGFAVLRVFIGMKPVAAMLALLGRRAGPFGHRSPWITSHLLGVITALTVVQQPLATSLVLNYFPSFASEKPATGLRRVWIVSIRLSLTCWLVANVCKRRRRGNCAMSYYLSLSMWLGTLTRTANAFLLVKVKHHLERTVVAHALMVVASVIGSAMALRRCVVEVVEFVALIIDILSLRQIYDHRWI